MYCINYAVQKGDTLYSISRHFNVGLDTIIAANPLVNVYNLVVGEMLCIPVSIPSNNYTDLTTYQVKEGDTLGSILANYGINLADLLQQNELTKVYLLPGTTLQVPNIEVGENDLT